MEHKYLDARTSPSESPPEPSKACYHCRRLKKHCDTTQPICARCTRLGIACMHNGLIERDVQRIHDPLFSNPTTDSVNYTLNYPIESRVHVPMLIRFFQDKLGLSPFQVEADSLAYYLRSTWISYALSDPCLLHATLFSASVQFDALTGAQQPAYATLYHQFKTINLVRSRLADLSSPNDATVASVLLLAMHSSLQFDQNLAQVHCRGLMQLIAARGGLDKLGYDGFLAQIIQGSLTFLAIFFDQAEPFPIPGMPRTAPSYTLISLILIGSNKSPSQHLRYRLLILFQNINQLLHEEYANTEARTRTTMNNPRLRDLLDKLWSEGDPSLLNSHQPPGLPKKELALLRTCVISGRVLAYLLDDHLPWSEGALEQLLEQLTEAIRKTERATWVKHGPEANMWVAVMGAAMVNDVNKRASFLLKENCVASSTRDTQPSRYVAAWFCYRWLKRRRLSRCAGLGT
ncbi:hypothetical protein EN45_062130 [Penicillium chrysogenum]|uniref:Zn(2)-C6 fungal-type domain-containing protein n=1 Tax=Penicillium chrysogenum TaxID=5076 RepID=A0A167SXF0_PENCH|nr:hypothetical protein EN45_062130 [Penicillium chrysogenum]